MRAVPGPLRRLLRERSRLVAVVLLAVVAIAASGIQSTAAATLQQTLDANWRGAYDILVTAKGNESALGGLLAPNSLSSGGDGLALADLARIRSVPGVGIAAPIGEIVVPRLKQGQVEVTLPKDAVPEAKKAPQAFRATLTYTTDDGLGERYVASSTQTIVVDYTPTKKPPRREVTGDCTLNGFVVTEDKYPVLFEKYCAGPVTPESSPITTTEGSASQYGGTDTLDNGAYLVSFPAEPQTATRITLVDPVAENALLGEAGDFLRPLATVATKPQSSAADLEAWAKASGTDFGADFLVQQKDRAAQASGFTSGDEYDEQRKLYADNGADFDKQMAVESGSYLPLLVSDAGAAPLSATLTVEPFGDAPKKTIDPNTFEFPFTLPDGIEDGGVGGAPESSTSDVSAQLNPFVSTTATVPWPGTEPVTLTNVNNVYNTLALQSPSTVGGVPVDDVTTTDGGTTASENAAGYFAVTKPQRPDADNLAADDDPDVPGTESTYVETEPLVGLDVPTAAVPVGSFSTTAVEALQSELSYVPLGAYQAIDSTLADGSVLQPSVGGLGLVGPRTVAIASIASAELWGQKKPISAVRVRVDGISSYTAGARNRVVAVTEALRKLGFTATIVAGSSPTAVSVHVDGYAHGVTDADQAQQVGPLGDVEQAWSELGAAARADLAISATSLGVLWVALASTAVLLGSVQVASVPRRRDKAALMREIGFTRGRIGRWMLAEEVPALLVVLLAGFVAALASGFTSTSVRVSAVVVAVVLATSVTAVVLGSRSSARASGVTSTRLRGATLGRFGVRQARVNLLTSVTQFVAVIIVALSAASLATLMLQGRADAGASRLAAFALGQSAIAQLVLGATGIAAGTTLAVLARRTELARRAPQWQAMRAMGFTRSELAVAQRAETASIVLPAVVVAGAAAWAGATAVAASVPLILVGVAVLAGVLVSIVLLVVAGKGRP